MFGDLFGGATTTQLDEVSKHFTIQCIALAKLLIVKGVITEAELLDALTKTTAEVDQGWQKRKEELQAEFAKEHPGVELFDKLFGNLD